ncbi:MAG: Hint domain-containing protein [Acetobacteraceae bacterium]
MTTFSWTRAQSGTWTTAADWTPTKSAPPRSGVAVIGATGAPYTVNFSTGSVSLARIMVTSADATLAVTGGVLHGNTLVSVAGSAIIVGAGARLTASAASRIGGALEVNSGTVSTTAALSFTAGATLDLAGGKLLDSRAVTLATGVGATLDGGATLSAGALTVDGTVIAAGGTDTIGFTSLKGAGTILAQSGTLVLTHSLAGATAALEIDAGAVIETTAAIAGGHRIAVKEHGAGASFVYRNATDSKLTFAIDGAQIGGGTVLDLALSPGVTVASGGAGRGTSGTDVLSNKDTLALSGLTGGGNWAVRTTTTAGGTELSVVPVCYVAGTRILTPDGPRPIETLRPGARVVTAGGEVRPVVWLGHRRLTPARHKDPARVAPVRVRRGALAPGIPRRDLLLSPDHALFLDGVLIAARQLVNGGSIVQEDAAGSVTYWHLELDRHAVVFAEGAAAETYLDTGNRNFFANAPGVSRLHPDDPAGASPDRAAGSCAPFVWEEAQVRPVWDRLAARAVRLGRPPPRPPTTTAPDLCLLLPGRRLAPLGRDGETHRFALPAGVRAVTLASRAARPTDTRPWLEDRRRLGMYVRRLRLDFAGACHEIPLDHPGLSAGWWAVEPGPRRWTDGAAVLDLPPHAGPGVLEVTIDPDAMVYPLAAAAPPLARAA